MKTLVKENRPVRRQENLYARKCTISGKGSMVRVPPSRRSPSACRKPEGPALNLLRLAKERFLRKRESKRLATLARARAALAIRPLRPALEQFAGP